MNCQHLNLWLVCPQVIDFNLINPQVQYECLDCNEFVLISCYSINNLAFRNPLKYVN